MVDLVDSCAEGQTDGLSLKGAEWAERAEGVEGARKLRQPSVHTALGSTTVQSRAVQQKRDYLLVQFYMFTGLMLMVVVDQKKILVKFQVLHNVSSVA